MRLAPLAIVLLFLGIIMSLSGCGPVSSARIEKSLTGEFPRDGLLLVDTRNGAIEVQVDGARTDMLVRATIRAGGATAEEAQQRADQATIEIAVTSNALIEVRARLPEPRHPNDGASLHVTVPSAPAGIDLRTSNGGITAADVDGAAIMVTSNGNVVARDIRGKVTTTTSNGSIELERVASGSLLTSNGAVSVTDVTGAISVSTSNGDVRLIEISGPAEIGTSNGNIELVARENFAGVIDASTSNGKVTLVGGGTVLRSESDQRSGRIEFRTAGPPSTLRTSNGSIEITTK